MLTLERIRELFDVDLEKGNLTRKKYLGPNAQVGMVAGSVNQDGYLQTFIDGKTYLNHRIIWFVAMGEWPSKSIDHIDCKKQNNGIHNLRQSSFSQNNANKGALITNKIGLKGVSWKPNARKWRSAIWKDTSIHLGYFDCPAAAHFAYIIAADKYHGQFARSAWDQ